MSYTIEYYKDSKGEWRWRARHSNGKVICESSEGYKRRFYCERARIRLFDKIVKDEYEIKSVDASG